ncbi:TPA: hypothetical protein ACHXFO_005244, partial [Escherichia coli]
MGRKSREKRERKLTEQKVDYDSLIHDMSRYRELFTNGVGEDTYFCKHLEATQNLFRRYKTLDVAVALFTSELWP